VSYVSRRRLDDEDFDPDAVDEDGLPLVYNEQRIASYWGRRPGELAGRWTKWVHTSSCKPPERLGMQQFSTAAGASSSARLYGGSQDGAAAILLVLWRSPPDSVSPPVVLTIAQACNTGLHRQP
jgi:hypothetical protein